MIGGCGEGSGASRLVTSFGWAYVLGRDGSRVREWQRTPERATAPPHVTCNELWLSPIGLEQRGRGTQVASMTRRQRLRDAHSAAVPTGHTRPDGELSVASLILPPVGAANPQAWGRPLATSRTAVAEPAPVSSRQLHHHRTACGHRGAGRGDPRRAPEEVAEKILAPEPLTPEETLTLATTQAADETAEVEARAETEAETATVVVLPVAPATSSTRNTPSPHHPRRSRRARASRSCPAGSSHRPRRSPFLPRRSGLARPLATSSSASRCARSSSRGGPARRPPPRPWPN